MTNDRQAVPRRRRRRPHLALVIGAGLGVLVIAAECIAITLQTAPRPALPSTALQPVLASQPRSVPIAIWTNGRSGTTSNPPEVTGRNPFLVAACQGGGSISITLSTTASITIDCSHPTTAGPLVLDSHTAGTVSSTTVAVAAGNPRYVVELRARAGGAARS